MKQRLSSLLAYVCIFISTVSLIYYSKDIALALRQLSNIELINFFLNVADILFLLIMMFYLLRINTKVDRQEPLIIEKMTNKVIKMFKNAFKLLNNNKNLL